MNDHTSHHSPEAEQSILGGLLLNPDAMHHAAERRLHASQFFDGRHRAIWAAIVELTTRSLPVDVLTIFEHLRDKGQAGDCGGLPYLNALAQSVPSAANMGRYVDIVQDKALRRELLAALEDCQTIAAETDGLATDKVDRVAAVVTKLSVRRQRSAPQAISVLFAVQAAHWQALGDGEAVSGIPTQLETVDKALGCGLKGGKLIVLAARPSVGKTALALQMLLGVASQGHAVLLLSLEMAAGELVDRAAANLGRVNLGAIASGNFGESDFSRLAEAMDKVAQMPLYIDDEPGLTLGAIRAKARAMQQRHGLAVVVVDYLQLCAGTNARDNRNQQIEEISRGLKVLAKELNITVIALSQLNRKSVERGEPDLSDLRDSGAIEQDADTVILLHPTDQMEEGAQIVAAIFAKNRQGRRGRIALAFHGATQRWSESSADVSRKGGNANQSWGGK